MLVEAAERTMCVTDASSVLIVGGVGCNERLQRISVFVCREGGKNFRHAIKPAMAHD